MNRTRLRRQVLLLLSVSVFAPGCNSSFHDWGTPQPLTEVGYEVPLDNVLVPFEPEVIEAPSRISMEDTSLWSNSDSIYFRDTRAFEVGDILTVDIFINDSAKLDNSSESEGEFDAGLDAATDLTLGSHGTIPPVTIGGSLNSNFEAERAGSINRKERINLQIAAVVTQASSNGNLRITGSQEVRVNHEVRILTVEGVVRTKDITPDNTIPYEKIAEARITYGGHNSRRKPHRMRRKNLYARHPVTNY